MGIKKSLAKISSHFGAKELDTIVRDRIRSCIQCQHSKQAPNTRIDHLASEVVTRVWEKVFFGPRGPYPSFKKGNTHLLTVVDYYSQFFILLPVKNNTKTKTIVDQLNKHVFSYFGFPKFVGTENVKYF